MLENLDLDFYEGQFTCVLGHNGSGKSTLAKHINALLSATEGTIWVDGMDVSKEENADIIELLKEHFNVTEVKV